jgi:beta-glucanase (GH16 family)
MRKAITFALLLAAGANACDKKYTSVKGDNCNTIAQKNGISVERVKELNSFLNCNDVWAWTPVCVDPPKKVACKREYRSVAGDNCESIGRKHNISGGRVKELNSFVNCNDIWAQTPICVEAEGGASASSNNGGKKLVWADEFNGNSVDWSKWVAEEGGWGWGNQELQFYTNRPANAYVKDGMLTIQALKENWGGRPYTSARLITAGKKDFMYGKVEARIKVPDGQGTWPAFWMLGSNIKQVQWPACGEIDIMETVGKDIKKTHASTHAPNFDTTWHKEGAPWSNDFHVYGVNWSENLLEFYVDGEVIHRVTPQPGKAWPFNSNQYILLNLAIGGTWPGDPDASTPFPRHMIVDYVRIYQ